MPLTMAIAGQSNQIKRINGKEEVIRFLESLGFVAGSEVTLVSQNKGDVIVKIKDSRIAISREMARRILI